jgi:hypothetical protein
LVCSLRDVRVQSCIKQNQDGKIKGLISSLSGRKDLRANKNSAAADSKP